MGREQYFFLFRYLLKAISPALQIEPGAAVAVDASHPIHVCLSSGRNPGDVYLRSDWTGFRRDVKNLVTRALSWQSGTINFVFVFDGHRIQTKAANKARHDRRAMAIQQLDELRHRAREFRRRCRVPRAVRAGQGSLQTNC